MHVAISQSISCGCLGPQAAACPADSAKKESLSTSFHRYFIQPGAPQEGCLEQAACMANRVCWGGLLGAQLNGFATETEAVAYSLA